MLHPLCALALTLAPTLSGGPQIRADRIGGAISDYGGRFAVKPVVVGPDEDKPGAFAFYDTRSGRSRDTAQGTFSLEIRVGAGVRLRTGRSITYDVAGWTEAITDGAYAATLRVRTVARNVYAVTATITGGPVLIEARIDGTVSTGATYDAADPPLVTVDDADRPPFGVALDSRPAPLSHAGTSGKTYQASVTTDAAAVTFLLAFDEQAARTRSVLAAAQVVEPDFSTAKLSPAHFTDARYLETQARAYALLRMGEVTDPSGAVLGGAAAKTHYNELWVWDSSFHALAVSEWDPMRAFAQLEGVYRGQVTDHQSPEDGLLYNHVDEAGQPVRLALPGYTDEFSQAPATGFAMREVFDRSAKDPAALAALQRSFDVSTGYLQWWQRRRDADDDGLAEFNGGWESGWDNSPRFTEVWGDSAVARFPVDDADPRPKLTCVDLNAWLYLYQVEMGRSAERLGRADKTQYETAARELRAKMEDADAGFWDESRGLYSDFTRGGGRRRFERTRTAVTIWPLFAGVTHDAARAKRVLEEHVLEPSRLWGEFGIPSVAFDDPDFAAADYWRGPVWLNVNYAAMIALWRYGYETEADELAQKTLDLASSDHGLWEYYDARTGKGLNVYQFGWSGALFLETLRHRYQAEAFDSMRGEHAKIRWGEIRRLDSLERGLTLAEVRVDGTYEVPRTKFLADRALFDGAPVTITFDDPHGIIGDKTIRVTFPAYPRAKPIVAHAGDTVVLTDYVDRECGTCAASPGVAVFLALLLLSRRRR